MKPKLNHEYVSPAAVGEPRKKVYINSKSEYVMRDASGARLGVYDLPNFTKKVCWVYNRFDNQTISDLNVQTPTDPDSIIVDYVCFSWMYSTDASTFFFGVKDNVRYSKWSNNGQFPYSDYYNADGTINSNNLFAWPTNQLEIYSIYQQNKTTNDNYNNLPKFICNILDYDKIKEATNTDFIIDEDLYLNAWYDYGVNNRFILNSGNLIRYYNRSNLPHSVICNAGNIISEFPESLSDVEYFDGGHSIIKSPSAGTKIPPMGPRGIYEITFDACDFIKDNDYYTDRFGNMYLNLNNILDRIVVAFTQLPITTAESVLVQFPTATYNSTFFMYKTFDVPYGMTIDLGGASIHISSNLIVDGPPLEFKSALEWNGITDVKDFNYVFGFTRHPTLPSIVYGTIRNANIWVSDDVRPDQLRVVLNLRHFSGVLENVNFNLRNFTGDATYPKGPYLLAMWQPLTKRIDGQGHESYSDQKIIRKCGVTCDAGRIDTPLAIFCHGDGYIIEQCNLGYVAILFGRGGVIAGCLNTKYFLFETTVNFIDAYFEVGQFEILNSQVKFSSGVITAQNNLHGKFSYSLTEVSYYGPWFAIDMEFSKIRLRHFLYDFHINCNNVFWEKQGDKYYQFAKQARPSIVEFDPSIVCETVYWGYQQPMSGQLFVKGKNARIIGMENFESTPRADSDKSYALLPINIPLINNQFNKFHTIVEIPSNMSMDVKVDQKHYPPEDYHITGTEWSSAMIEDSHIDYPDPNPPIPAPDPTLKGTTWNNISAFIELDNKRRLRSYILNCNDEYELLDGDFPSVGILANFAVTKHKNLNVVLRSSFNNKLYEARLQFKRVNHISEIGQTGDTSNLIDNHINPLSKNAEYPIAGFAIMQAVNPTENDFSGTDFSLTLYNEYGYNQPGVKYKHTYGNFEYIGDDNTRDDYDECTKIVPLNDINIRAYMIDWPMYGEWTDGDEIVWYNENTEQTEWHVRIGGEWEWINPKEEETNTKK